ncbi:hypothetical protein G5C51_04525 [Streptomyces sp. A7024]|uniref:Uncharacterized protein n=1 Tax=Streptomyces coryli TaxID=1128680 RepID=A0A6G4TTN5_9ACTN|nr:hypothetical protein [Streptomyces coryli]NGN63173.1 hypothetical protein [Streptomyces coryli]
MQSPDYPVVDAPAFPLFSITPTGEMILLQPVPRTAAPELDEAYTNAAFDSTSDTDHMPGTGVNIDVHWRVAADLSHVLLVLNGRTPRHFKLGVRLGATEDRERDFFLDMARHHQQGGPVVLFIYPDKEDVVRAMAALQKGDPLFTHLGIGVESDVYCRPLLRLARATTQRPEQ